MFKFLKNKLKNVVDKFSKKIDEEGKEEEIEIEKEPEVTQPQPEQPTEEPKPETKKEPQPTEEPKPETKKEPQPTEEPKKEKIPTIHELAQRKKQKQQETSDKPPKITKLTEKQPIEIIKTDKPKPSAKQILKQLEPKPPQTLAQELIDEVVEEKDKAEQGILTAKEIREKFDKERQERQELKPEPKAKGFFAKLKQKVITKRINEKQFEEIFWDLEVGLMENNVAIEVIEKIKKDLQTSLVDQPINRGKIPEIIQNSLKNSIIELFDVDKINLINEISFHKKQHNKPYIICFLGINGSGKTTTIAKLTHLLKKNNMNSVIAAADTFRAAAIQQLEEHGTKLNTKVIKHDYGADAAAVAFDAIKYAEAHNLDAVLIDTAGRMHSNVNLMDELKKIIRVSSPNLNIFVGESITGNDCVDQAKKFDTAVGINAVVLTKADIDEKGGAALSVSFVTKRPILYLGMGQEYDDLQVFDKDKIIENLGFE